MLAVLILTAMLPLDAIADTANSKIDYEEIFENNKVLMLFISPKTGEIIEANKEAEKFYGYDMDTLTSMNVSQINIGSTSDVLTDMEDAANQNANFFKFKHRLADGSVRDVEVYSYPTEYAGEPVLFSIIHDITDKTLLQVRHRSLMTLTSVTSLLILIALIILILRLRKRSKELEKINKRLDNSDRVRDAFINANNSFVYLKDENLKYIFANKALLKYYNRKEEEVLGKVVYDVLEKGFAQNSTETDTEVLVERKTISGTVQRKGRFYRTIKFPVLMSNGAYGVGAFINDITEEHEMEKEMERMVQQNKLLYEVISLNFQSTQEQLDYALNGILEILESEFGYLYIYNEERGEFTLSSWSKGVMEACKVGNAPILYKLADAGLWAEAVRQGKPIIVNDLDKPNPLKKGYPEGHVKLKRLMSVPIVIDGKIEAVAGIGNKPTDYEERDVKELLMLTSGVWNGVQRRKSAETLKHVSFHDPLTGLYNRRFFEEELRRLDTSRNLPISILVGDIDDLKLINDIFGHTKGDELIVSIAKAISSVCRQDDIVARWGGDEFVVLLPKTNEEEANYIVERIKAKVSSGNICGIRSSISIASDTKNQEPEDVNDIISNAETKMYTLKTLKRDDLHGEELNAITQLLFSTSQREKNHGLRVGEMSKKLGIALGLAESDVKRLENAGMLHDIGMVVLDQKLIEKDRYSLSPTEKIMIDQHATTGSRLLNYFDKTFDIGEDILATMKTGTVPAILRDWWEKKYLCLPG
jgi:diguanylate cyclase (GGDEF)-like protein/PAS domain S-box-containing protein